MLVLLIVVVRWKIQVRRKIYKLPKFKDLFMQMSKYKKNHWENYRSIARDYGITVPALKNIFREEGLLEGNRLTANALEKEIGVRETITSRFGTDERILWNVPEINFILGKRNMTQLIGNEVFFFAENFSQITQTIGYLGRNMLLLLKFSLETESAIKILPEWYRKKFGNALFDPADQTVRGLQEAIYESHRYLYVADQNEFINLLEHDFHRAFELSKVYPANEYEKIRLMFFKRLYQFIGEWATDRRISQYHRQPRKIYLY